MHLIATQAFEGHAQGERITDAAEVFRILKGPSAAFVVVVPANDVDPPADVAAPQGTAEN